MSKVQEEWEECGACLDDELPARWPILAPHLVRDAYFFAAREDGVIKVAIKIDQKRIMLADDCFEWLKDEHHEPTH